MPNMKFIKLLSMFVLMTVNVVTAQDNSGDATHSFTHHQADGNRIVQGAGTFPAVVVQDVILHGVPVWVVGYATQETLVWFVSLENGNLDRVELGLDGTVIATELFAEQIAAQQPFVVGVANDGVEFIFPAAANGSSYTHPISVGENMNVYIDSNGDLVLSGDDEILHRLELNAMLDARLVTNSDGLMAVYINPTDQRYVHGIMGDRLEAASIAILEITENQLQIASIIDLPNSDVFEGLLPLWADVDADGSPDLVTTVSNNNEGAQIQVYSVSGQLLASGPAIGTGQRWRHQLAWGAFGPGGELELVDVLTPHIGGVVEFYRYADGQLNVVATQSGYTSHVNGSRNLDMAVAGDFNGDEQLEIVVPSQSRYQIAAIQHNDDGNLVNWEFDVGGRIITNLSAINHTSGLSLAVGTDQGLLRVWISMSSD
jgi:hypothetical protein